MSLADFAALNERRAEQGLSTFMNPRNSAAGTIRQLDPKLMAERPLSMWSYGVGVTEGITFASHWDALQWLKEHGFRVNDDVARLTTEDEVVARCRPGSSAAASSTSRSTASWSRSTTSSCSAGSASSGAIRAGRSPGSSRPPRRSRA